MTETSGALLVTDPDPNARGQTMTEGPEILPDPEWKQGPPDEDGDYECDGCHQVFDDRTHPSMLKGEATGIYCPTCIEREPMEGDIHEAY